MVPHEWDELEPAFGNMSKGGRWAPQMRDLRRIARDFGWDVAREYNRFCRGTARGNYTGSSDDEATAFQLWMLTLEADRGEQNSPGVNLGVFTQDELDQIVDPRSQ